MSKKTNFNVENIELIREDPESQFTTLEIHAFSSGKNKHDMTCSEEVLMSTAYSIYDKPVVYNYADMIGDFGTHTDPERTLIAGFVISDSAVFTRLDDGRLGLFVKAKLWKYYVPKVIELLKMSNGTKKVSVEMDLFSKINEDTGIEEMLDFEYSGVCILGDLIEEASPGAHLKVETFAKKNLEFKKAKDKEFGLYEGIDFKIPEEVRTNVQKGMELKNVHGRGGSSVVLTIARHLIKNEVMTPEKLKLMNRYLSRYKEMNLKDKESNEWISWNLLGGNSGLTWAEEIVEKMKRKEEMEMKYFERESVGMNTMNTDNDKSSEKEVIYMEEEKEFEKDMEKEDMAEETSDSEKEDEEIKEESKEYAEETEEVEEKEEEMSLDANLDVKAILSFLEEETEDYKAMSEKYSVESEEKDFSEMALYMFGKMKYMKDKMESLEKEKEEFTSKMEQMSKDQEVYMSENMELKKYKEDKEKESFEFSVDGVLKEIEGRVKIPQTEMEELKTLALEKYSVESFEEWSNFAKAKAFSFTPKENKEKKEDFLRFDWGRNTKEEKVSKRNPWEKKKE